jgi:hypothetical protein
MDPAAMIFLRLRESSPAARKKNSKIVWLPALGSENDRKLIEFPTAFGAPRPSAKESPDRKLLLINFA